MAKKTNRTARKTTVRKNTPAAPARNDSTPAQTTNPNRSIPWPIIGVIFLLLVIAALFIWGNNNLIAAQNTARNNTQQQQAVPPVNPTAEAPASGPNGTNVKPPAESELTQITPKHINAFIAFPLVPGASINGGGHIYVNNQLYPQKDGRVVVVTNNSTKVTVVISSSAGVGWENNTDFNTQVKSKFLEGCGPNGCDEVVWANITDEGTVNKIITKAHNGLVEDYDPNTDPLRPNTTPAQPTPAPTKVAPKATAAPAAKPTVTKCPEGAIAQGDFKLPPSCVANGGHISYGDKNPKQIDGSVVLLRNNSSKEIVANTTSGANYGGDVQDILTHGCGPSGCALVYEIVVTDNGSTLTNRTK